jgi:hypothetical protein
MEAGRMHQAVPQAAVKNGTVGGEAQDHWTDAHDRGPIARNVMEAIEIASVSIQQAGGRA